MIVNLQRKLLIDTKAYEPFVSRLRTVSDEGEAWEISIAFVSDRKMKELNKFFRNKNTTTDVLSFPYEPDEFETVQQAGFTVSGELPPESGSRSFLGDIVISVEQAQRQAKENGLTLEREIKQLILHGVLHLCGYDHETDNGEMNRRELDLRKELSI